MSPKPHKVDIPYKCDNCGNKYSKKDYRNGHEKWIFRRKNNVVIGMYCYDCAQRLIYSPKRDRTYGNTKRYMFGHKVVYGWAPRRTGYCSKCPKNMHDKSAQRTQLHHEFYVTCMPWAGSIELCVGCHRRTHGGRPFFKGIIYNGDGEIVKCPIIIH